jgi:hypothetical protein
VEIFHRRIGGSNFDFWILICDLKLGKCSFEFPGPCRDSQLASTHTRVFQVQKSVEVEGSDGVKVTGQEVFQFGFKQFQVRGGRDSRRGAYVDADEKRAGNG